MTFIVALASVLGAIVLGDATPYGPSDLFNGFAAQALAVVPWVGAGIAAAIGLYFALLGIRKGLAWFFSVVRKG